MIRTGVWLLALLWMAAILYTSSLGQAVTPVGGVIQTLVSKLGHVLEYAIVGGLLAIAVSWERASLTQVRLILIVAIVGGVFAGFDELRQSFVPGREPRITDVLIDLASVLAGAIGVTRGLGLSQGSDVEPASEAILAGTTTRPEDDDF